MKILCIANSFGEDSTKYLYQMAAFAGMDMKVVNLYIGGCCLENHYNNMKKNLALYDYQLNGKSTGRLVTLSDVLSEEQWDVVTLQQCSGYSGILESYEPYFEGLYNFINQKQPKSKIMIHQTWAYEVDSDHGQFNLYENNQAKMYQQLVECYHQISTSYKIEIIPFGQVIQHLRGYNEFDYEKTGFSFCRDGFHMDLIYGRYALALVWYGLVLGGQIELNDYRPKSLMNELVDQKVLDRIKEGVAEIISTWKKN